MSETQRNNKVFVSHKMAAHLYWNGAMLYFNATIGEKWKDIDFYGDWEAQFSSFLMDEADLIARHVAQDRIDPHAESLAEHFECLKTACFGEGGLDIEAAISHLGKIGYHGAQVMAAREVARSKIEQSKKLLKKRIDPINARRKKIQELWASGKFTSRDRCAEEEWEALGFPSYRAARESLSGTPDPTKTR